MFGGGAVGSIFVWLLIISVLTSASASTQTTILPTARTALSMGDSIGAVGLMIALSYGMTGFACDWHYLPPGREAHEAPVPPHKHGRDHEH